jgi:hypothetical protein
MASIPPGFCHEIEAGVTDISTRGLIYDLTHVANPKMPLSVFKNWLEVGAAKHMCVVN